MGYPIHLNAVWGVLCVLYSGYRYETPRRAPPPRRPDVTISQRQKRNSLERVLFLLFPKSRTCGRFSPKIREQGSLSKASDLLIVQSIINTHTLLKVLTWPSRAQALLSEGVLTRVHLVNLIVGRFCLTSAIGLGRFCLSCPTGSILTPDQSPDRYANLTYPGKYFRPEDSSSPGVSHTGDTPRCGKTGPGLKSGKPEGREGFKIT